MIKTIFTRAGKFKLYEEYKKDVRHGVYKKWHDNGVLMTEGRYDNGGRIGRWHTFSEDGTLKSIFIYK